MPRLGRLPGLRWSCYGLILCCGMVSPDRSLWLDVYFFVFWQALEFGTDGNIGTGSWYLNGNAWISSELWNWRSSINCHYCIAQVFEALIIFYPPCDL